MIIDESCDEKNTKTTAANVIDELNVALINPVSTKIIIREFLKHGFSGRAAFQKLLLMSVRG